MLSLRFLHCLDFVAEHADDFCRLVLAQKAVVHKDAGQLIADGFMDQDGCDRAVDAPGHRNEHAAHRRRPTAPSITAIA